MSRYVIEVSGISYAYGFDEPTQTFFLNVHESGSWKGVVGDLSTVPGTGKNLANHLQMLGVGNVHHIAAAMMDQPF